MSPVSPKDRVSLCLFTFTDGRRCRTPRTGRHPHFCFYHAQRRPAPKPRKHSPKTSPAFFPATIFPPAISAPPSPASSRRCPRQYKTQTRPHHRLYGPNPDTDHPPGPQYQLI